MGHSNVRLKVRRRKVAHLAAYSRQFTVKNNTVPKTELNQKNCYFDWDKRTQFGRFEIHTYGHLFSIDKDGHYHLEDTDCSWKPAKYPQPKSLRKKYKKKYYMKGTHDVRKIVEHPSDYTQFKKYPYTLQKMNKVQYYEKLVEHKLEKWERKNPKPADMFTEDVEKWKQERETAKERFRDFVISIYDPLIIMGNRVNAEKQKMDASKIAEVKDVDGKGHDVSFPNLSTEDKLYKNAESAAKTAMKKDASILDADLMNHKRNQKRPLLGAKRITLADKKLKKAA